MAKPPLNGVSETEYTKSHQREFSPLVENSSRVHELVAYSMRGECVRHGSRTKVGGFAVLRDCILPTRANMSHEKAEQIRARIVCTPAEKKMGGRESSTHADRTDSAFFICLLVVLGFYLVGVGAPLSRRCQAHPFSSHNKKISSSRGDFLCTLFL